MSATIQLADGFVDLGLGIIDRGGRVVPLGPTERRLLAYMAARPGATLERDELYAAVWGYSRTAQSRTLDVYVGRLRAKLEADPRQPVLIRSVRGVGYRFVPPSRPPTPVADGPRVLPPPDRLIGRDADLAAVADALGHAAVVTVVGPPGVGKTRLVRELASRDGTAVWCELAACDGRGVARAVAAALGAPDLDGAVRALRARDPACVVLDDVEHVRDTVRAVVGTLSAIAGVSVLATSMLPLEVAGEHVHRLARLDPRPDSDAVALYLDRALQHDPSFDADAHRADIEALVIELGGLPLGITLAAARVRSYPPARMREHLRDSMDVLRRRGATPAARRDSLRGALEASYGLLDADCAAVLTACAVFQGPARMAFLAAMVGEQTADDAVEELLDRGWLHVVPAACTALDLAPVARRFVRERRPPDHALRRAHAEAFATVGPHHPFEEADLHAAASWAVAHADADLALRALERVGVVLGDFLDAEALRALTDRVAARDLTASGRLRVERIALGRAPPRQALPALRRLGRDTATLGDTRLAADIAHLLGLTLRRLGHYRRAARVLQAAVALGEREGAPRLASFTSDWAVALRRVGDLHGATVAGNRALALHRRAGNRYGEAHALGSLAIVHALRGRMQTAIALIERSRDGFRATGAWHHVAVATGNMAACHLELGNLERSRTLGALAVSMFRRFGAGRGEGFVLDNLGHAARAAGDLGDALRWAREALETHQREQNRSQEAHAHLTLADLHVARGARAMARTHVDTARSLAAHVPHPSLTAAIAAAEGCLIRDDDPAAAVARFDAAIALYDAAGMRAEAARTRCRRAVAHWRCGRPEPARDDLRVARLDAESMGVTPASALAQDLRRAAAVLAGPAGGFTV